MTSKTVWFRPSLMRLTGKVYLLVIGFLIIMSNAGIAEVIYMKNGDQLSDEVMKKTSGKITFKTPYAGTIYVNRSQILKIGGTPPSKAPEAILLIKPSTSSAVVSKKSYWSLNRLSISR